MRRLYRALGSRLADARLLAAPEDVFYLSMDEVAGVVRGTSVQSDHRALVALRKREHEGYRRLKLAPRIVTHGIVHANELALSLPAANGETTLRGIGCSPGTVEASALVVEHPDAGLRIDGQVLVAASTDPGWVFLMIAAGGLISEKGSVLSHTAIIGRELGIPTVVGVAHATSLLRDGERIALDGRAGTVERVAHRAEEEST